MPMEKSRRKPSITLEQINIIKRYSEQGYSANQIQRKLQEQKLGVRRQVMLAHVRKAKKQPTKPRARVEKHVPKKYRKRATYAVAALPEEPIGVAVKHKRKKKAEVSAYKRMKAEEAKGKHVSIWRDNRRWEVYGSSQDLLDFIANTGLYYGPRERFTRINAEDVEPDDIGEEWYDRPNIESD